MRIALVGKSRAGKDTVGDMLWLNSDGYTSRVSFGQALKEGFHKMFTDIPSEPKPRDGYEKYGKAMRDIDNDIWVKKLDFHIGVLEEYDIAHSFVITDMRQPNEAKWARENGFMIVRIFADAELRKERSVNDSEFQETTESEKYIDEIEYDFAIDNIGTLDDLKQQVMTLLKIYKDGATYAE